MELNQSQLKERIHYDPDTGRFTWLKDSPLGGARLAGKIAGCIANDGYMVIGIRKRTYKAHRLVFLYMESEMPAKQVDHINRNRSDNRWCNLRHATHQENQQNMSNNTDFIGVSWRKRTNQWTAQSRLNGRVKYLGIFKTHLAACYARHYYDIKNNLSRESRTMGVTNQ